MFVDACITISDPMESILCYDPTRCYHFYEIGPGGTIFMYAGYTKAHTIMNANKALVLYNLFCNKNVSTEIKLLML